MKKITAFLMAASVAASSTTAFAGGIESAEVEPEPTVVPGPNSSSAGGLLVLLMLGITAAAVLGGDTSGSNEEEIQ